MAAAYFVDESGLRAFVDALAGSRRVIAPVAKRGKFAFEELSSAGELRLDYDVTILPPKKVFFPPAQPIVRFSEGKVESCTCGIDTVLLGVHFYDVKAIDQLDYLMRENNADWDYLCQREATTIVASNIQAVSPRAFWDSVGAGVDPQGHDAFLTKIASGYVLETRTDKGEALVAHGSFREATDAEVAEAKSVNDAVMGTCPERLEYTTEEIATRVCPGTEALVEAARHGLACVIGGFSTWACATDALFDALPPVLIVLDSYVRFLYHIGEHSMPAAFVRIVHALRRGNSVDMLRESNTVFMLEVLLQRHVYARPLELKRDSGLREAILNLLDVLVDSGSSAAFRMRDDFVTPAA